MIEDTNIQSDSQPMVFRMRSRSKQNSSIAVSTPISFLCFFFSLSLYYFVYR